MTPVKKIKFLTSMDSKSACLDALMEISKKRASGMIEEKHFSHLDFRINHESFDLCRSVDSGFAVSLLEGLKRKARYRRSPITLPKPATFEEGNQPSIAADHQPI